MNLQMIMKDLEKMKDLAELLMAEVESALGTKRLLATLNEHGFDAGVLEGIGFSESFLYGIGISVDGE